MWLNQDYQSQLEHALSSFNSDLKKGLKDRSQKSHSILLFKKCNYLPLLPGASALFSLEVVLSTHHQHSIKTYKNESYSMKRISASNKTWISL